MQTRESLLLHFFLCLFFFFLIFFFNPENFQKNTYTHTNIHTNLQPHTNKQTNTTPQFWKPLFSKESKLQILFFLIWIVYGILLLHIVIVIVIIFTIAMLFYQNYLGINPIIYVCIVRDEYRNLHMVSVI